MASLMPVYLVWCGFCWVVRGGLYARFYKWLHGLPADAKVETTQEGRGVAAFLMVAPLAYADPWLALVWPALWAGMTIGYFDNAMGLEEPGRDHFFLALWGLIVVACPLAAIASYRLDFTPLLWAPLGAGVMPIYALNKAIGNRWGLDWTLRSEAMAGAFAIGPAIWLGVH